MRIALVHSFYRSAVPSGENTVVNNQLAALRDAGHEVALIARRTDDVDRTPGYPLRAAATVITGRGASPTQALREFRPDIVHVHNLFPNFGDAWVRGWQGPLVATLHNFRALCANGLLYRDGDVCTQCLPPSLSWSAVRHRCYHGSLTGSIPLAIRNSRGPDRNHLLSRADRLIALSERSQQVFASAMRAEMAGRIEVIPNGLADRGDDTPQANRRHWAIVGRLSQEKGVAELLHAWPGTEPLVVVGDGPLRRQLQAAAPESVRFVGGVDPVTVDDILRSSWGLLFPSRCFEGFPTVVAEALMQGTPVVALTGNSGADFVSRNAVGATYTGAADLPGALAQVREDAGLSAHCRRIFREQLTVDAWVARLVDCYRAAGTSG